MDSDSDKEFNEDVEALKRACRMTQDYCRLPPAVSVSPNAYSDDESSEDDLHLVQSFHHRFSFPMNAMDTPSHSDLSDSDDCEHENATLMAIQRRFAAYSEGGLRDITSDVLHSPVQVVGTIIGNIKESSSSSFKSSNAQEGFVNCVDTSEPTPEKQTCDVSGGSHMSDLVELDHQADDASRLPHKSSDFPSSALKFVDAINKNRSCQKLIRSKMMQLEARIEELRKLMEHVKILKDFQVACKKRTGRALSQKRDARMQLIATPKPRPKSKSSERAAPVIYKGPLENPHVSNFKKAMDEFGIFISRGSWSTEERENLVKGVKQQFQGMLLQRSVDLFSEYGSENSGYIDTVMSSIKDVTITPERMRSFLPKVNWEQLAAMYVPGHTGEDCQSRFLNYEDPLSNHGPWTVMEDKNLLYILQQRGLSNWIEIAASLGTNRTPSQCLARYQRSLNPSMLKREWSTEEDNQLRAAVETYGESNWQLVAAAIEGRAGTQCSNRWLKTLHPARKRVGKWTAEEDKRLKVAVVLLGPKTWKKVASCVPGRTHVQCRERWVNCLDPSLNLTKWSEEEDKKLEAAISEHGYCWSKVAANIPHRTDNQCWRRWKTLFPNEVAEVEEARRIQKCALISNFVDRESERTALRASDFIMPETGTSRSSKRGKRVEKEGSEIGGSSGLAFEDDMERSSNREVGVSMNKKRRRRR